MPRTGLSKEEITEVAVKLANENGLSYLSITTLAEALDMGRDVCGIYLIRIEY